MAGFDHRSREGDFPGKGVLHQATEEEVLARLADGDPLQLRERCIDRLRARTLLLPYQDLLMRTQAKTARAAMSYEGQPELDVWLEERIDEGITALLRAERELEGAGLPPFEPLDTHCSFLSEALGIDPVLTRRACVVFNDLPNRPREVFWALVVEQKPLAAYASEDGGRREDIMQSLRVAFTAMSLLQDTMDGGHS